MKHTKLKIYVMDLQTYILCLMKNHKKKKEKKGGRERHKLLECFRCGEPIEIGQMVVSKYRSHSIASQRHLDCAIESKLLTTNVVTLEN